MKKIKYILASLLAVTSLAAHATLRMPDITVTKITTTGVNTNVGFKVKDSNEWLKADAGEWTVTSTDTPVQGAIGDKDYSGFFFQPENSYSGSTSTPYYHFTYALADINDPANGIVVDPTTTGGTLLAPRRGPDVVSYDYFLIEASTSNTTLYVLIYKGKVYGTADITKATKFEAYQLANVNHDAECDQEAEPATCEGGGVKAKYHCTICDKYFEEEACTNETSSEIEEIPALGHNYQVVKDLQDNASWTWVNVYSKAILHVCCSRSNCYATDDQTVATTSEITTQPTTEAAGVLTCSAKVTYNEVEYTGTKTEEIPQLTSAEQSVTENKQVSDNSWTVINASNTVAEGTNAPTITVTPGTAENPTTANIIITGENTDAKVNVSVPANATVNIYGDGKAKVSGNIGVESGGKVNTSGVTVDGSITASGGTLNISGSKVDGSITASAGAAVTLSNTNVTSTTGPAITAAQGATVTIGHGRYEGSERAVSITGDGVIKVADGRQAYGGLSSVGPFTVIGGSNLRQQSGAKARRTQAVDYAPAYKVLIVCDPADSHSDDKFAGHKPFGSSELAGVYVCDNGCGTTKVAATPTYTREMANQWGTIVLPFAITYSQSNDNYKLYRLTAAAVNGDQGTLTFTEYDDQAAIPAGTPMAIKALTKNSSEKYVISFTAGSNSVSSTITPTTAVNGLTMKGTYAELTGQTGMYFIASNQFWMADAAITIAPFRAWFEGTISGSVKSLNIVVEDETDGINEIVNGKLSNGKLLENGRIVILNNGVKYNANGQRIK